jgi:hypothetical protein
MNFRNPSVLQTLLVLCLRTSFDPVVAAHAHKGLRKAQEHAEHSNPPDPISQSYPDLLYGNPYEGGCVDSPLGWYDDTFGDTCDWYASSPADNCNWYGLSVNEVGVTANMACCACGGGSTAPPTPGPTHAVPPPTPSPTYEGGGCVDSPPGWYDIFGDNCDWYASSPENCDWYGQYANKVGVTAFMACCACGGGSTAPPTPGPTHAVPPPTPSPTYEDGGCVDSPSDWYDNIGDNCDWYASFPYNCDWYGKFPNKDGVTANMACCACGGGSTAA